MTINSTMKVREVALQIPQATSIFEKLQIDYCCGGDRLLTEACSAAGLDVSNVLRMLDESLSQTEKGPVDFQGLSLNELITHILDTHHVYTKEEMVRIQLLTAKVVSAHGLNHPELTGMSDLFGRLCDELTPHMFKEERILFPFILELEKASIQKTYPPFPPFGSVKNPIRMMMMEHDTAGDILRQMRELSRDYEVPADGCMSYTTLYGALTDFEKDLHQHIHLENNLLFPRAIQMEQQLMQTQNATK